MEKFWLLEEFPKKYNLTVEEQNCEDHFNETHTRDKDGRFVVHLPLKDNYKELGDSYDIAKRRLNAMERKLSKHPELKRQYDAFMQEYIELGHSSFRTRQATSRSTRHIIYRITQFSKRKAKPQNCESFLMLLRRQNQGYR